MNGNFGNYGEPFYADGKYTVKERLDLLSLLPQHVLCNSILEIGCADGTNLKFFAHHLKVPLSKCEGVDICMPSNQVEDEIKFTHSSVEAYILNSSKKFDLILLSDVLEHLYNPWRVLSQLKDLLTQSGHLLISVPNIQNLQYLNAVNSGNFYYQKTGLFDETHIRFFSFTALKNYLAEIDFRVLRNSWRPDLSLQSMRSGIEAAIRENNYANLQISNLGINISDVTLDEYFGQQILICATHE